jgi:hypothetical protein
MQQERGVAAYSGITFKRYLRELLLSAQSVTPEVTAL